MFSGADSAGTCVSVSLTTDSLRVESVWGGSILALLSVAVLSAAASSPDELGSPLSAWFSRAASGCDPTSLGIGDSFCINVSWTDSEG